MTLECVYIQWMITGRGDGNTGLQFGGARSVHPEMRRLNDGATSLTIYLHEYESIDIRSSDTDDKAICRQSRSETKINVGVKKSSNKNSWVQGKYEKQLKQSKFQLLVHLVVARLFLI